MVHIFLCSVTINYTLCGTSVTSSLQVCGPSVLLLTTKLRCMTLGRLLYGVNVYNFSLQEVGHVTYGSLMNKVIGQSGLNIQEVCWQFSFHCIVCPKW
jgi:hypothetical protein